MWSYCNGKDRRKYSHPPGCVGDKNMKRIIGRSIINNQTEERDYTVTPLDFNSIDSIALVFRVRVCYKCYQTPIRMRHCSKKRT